MKIEEHNRHAWDRMVEVGNQYTRPVTPDVIAAARLGNWELFVTPTRPVPPSWIHPIVNKQVLCLAGGGGLQGPILAAAGAIVTVFDNSPRQLQQDIFVSQRDSLPIRTILGNMTDLGTFADESFDLIIHPVSNVFVADVKPVWHEASRILRRGGTLVSGFDNPMSHMFDDEEVERTGKLEIKHPIPYSDAETLTETQRKSYESEGRPLEFGHSLEDQIGGQIAAGFTIAGFFEDRDASIEENILNKYSALYIATRAVKT